MNFDCSDLPESNRLQFRVPLLSDAAFYLSLTQSRDYIRFISDAGLQTTDDAMTYIREKVLQRFEDFGVGLWVIELKDTRQPVGICGLVIRDELPCPDLGYALLEDYRGRGLAKEAGKAVLDFATSQLHLPTLCAITDPENVRSAKLLKGLGFRQDGQRDLKEIGATSNYFIWNAASNLRDPIRP